MKKDNNIPDIDKLFDNSPSISGPVRLWLMVIWDAVDTIKNGGGGDERAIDFLFDLENPFLNMTADALDIAPDDFRKRMRRSLES